MRKRHGGLIGILTPEADRLELSFVFVQQTAFGEKKQKLIPTTDRETMAARERAGCGLFSPLPAFFFHCSTFSFL